MAATAPSPWLNLAKTAPNPVLGGETLLKNKPDLSAGSCEGSESPDDETELTRLFHELQDVGRGPIASPDISLGDAIVKNIHS